MRIILIVVAGGLLALLPVRLIAQEVDMAVMMKWSEAKVVAYNIVGAYQAETPIAFNEKSGQVADVTDRVIVDVQWDLQRNLIIGQAKVQNFPSEVTKLRNLMTSCPPPVVKGTYDQVDITEVASSEAERIDLTGIRSFPDADITACDGVTERRSVASAKETVVEYLPMPSPVTLGMPSMPPSGEMTVTVSPDRKTFVIKLGGWTWSYTPTLIS